MLYDYILVFILNIGSTPMREVLSVSSDMTQPLLLIISTDYYIKVHHLFMKIEHTSLELGLAYYY